MDEEMIWIRTHNSACRDKLRILAEVPITLPNKFFFSETSWTAAGKLSKRLCSVGICPVVASFWRVLFFFSWSRVSVFLKSRIQLKNLFSLVFLNEIYRDYINVIKHDGQDKMMHIMINVCLPTRNMFTCVPTVCVQWETRVYMWDK